MRLGRIVDIELDPESHLVMTYVVQPGRLTQPIARKSLRINRSQVASFTNERMVVDDLVSRLPAEQRTRGLTKNAPSPISARSL
jgi:hypothetical protein